MLGTKTFYKLSMTVLLISVWRKLTVSRFVPQFITAVVSAYQKLINWLIDSEIMSVVAI